MKPFLFLIIFLYHVISHSSYSCDLSKARSNSCKDLIKMNIDSGLGRCLKNKTPDNIERVFHENKIEVFSGNNPKARNHASDLKKITDYNDSRIIALARVVYTIASIGDGRMRALKDGEPIQVVFANKKSKATNSRRVGNQIQLTGGNQNSIGTGSKNRWKGQDNHGLIAHELAHAIAKRDSGKILNDYQEFLSGQHCDLTSYCKQNRSEEFAEVFAAYLTLPQAFKSFIKSPRSKACGKAFNFMKKLFGEPNMKKNCQARKDS